MSVCNFGEFFIRGYIKRQQKKRVMFNVKRSVYFVNVKTQYVIVKT